MIESIKSKISDRKFRIDSAIVAGTTGIGAAIGIEKNKLNAKDFDTAMFGEISEYSKQISQNCFNISDANEFAKRNQEATDIFLEKFNACYKLLKKYDTANLLLGITIGATVGVLGVILKSKIFKGKENVNSSNKKQLDIQS